MKYEIAYGFTIGSLIESVNSFIEQGYKPHGGVFIIKTNRETYNQPMIKEEPLELQPHIVKPIPLSEH